ncbi:hypothetical protein, partial [Acinetobacter johnsonii]|uniref:hypothetical protein n=1 Tax=Acinetobacter johnsonii TaxID=40214 RepID=UPI001F31C19F
CLGKGEAKTYHMIEEINNIRLNRLDTMLKEFGLKAFFIHCFVVAHGFDCLLDIPLREKMA